MSAAEAPSLPAPGRLGVLGWPVFHSRSPAMHNAALRALRLDHAYAYQHLPAPPPLLREIVRALGPAGLAGAKVTIPHKHAALALADTASATARAIGAANTLTFLPGGGIEAENTDAPGLLQAIGRDPAGTSVQVLGAGGSARAAAYALRNAGASVRVWNRTPERARRLAADLKVEAVDRPRGATILVNTTTVGMDERTSEADALRSLGLDSDALGSYEQVVDLVYSSAPTPLLTAARSRGLATVDGLEVLVAQGALSFRRWTGRVAPLQVMREAAEGGRHG